jgi:ketosteroid isomerase-like protein
VSLKAVTDERGRYSIKNIPYGQYTLMVSAQGYLSYEAPVYILSDAETQLHVRLRMEREEQEEIQRQFLRYQRALSSKDAETMGDLYTAEAVSLLQNQPPRKGREAIAARWKQSFGGAFSLDLTSAEILLSPGGQEACQYGTFEIHSAAADAALLASGKWAYVWRKEEDVWRIALEIDNFDSRKE